MPFPIYIGWGLLAPVCLSLFYGSLSYPAMKALGYQPNHSVRYRISVYLFPMLLFLGWGMFNIPLPLMYILAFLEKMFRIDRKNMGHTKELILVNLSHLTSMALHMILIGVFSLILRMPMNELLRQPFWRILTICSVLAANSLLTLLIPHTDIVGEVFRTQAESAEVRPFLIFLWFCNAFLLVDSVLCISSIDWRLLPLFLVGSTVLLEFYLIRFLKHLYNLLKEHYVEEEHRSLMKKLEQQKQDAAKLRSRSERDPMTKVFTRRYVLEQIEFLLKTKESFSFVYLDLDHLKQINDKKGHEAGDHYISRFAEEFSRMLRKTDIFSRVGGDEFVVLLPGCEEEKAAERMEAIRSRLSEEFHPPYSFSYGIFYVSGRNDYSVEQIFRSADLAMYQDKQARES